MINEMQRYNQERKNINLLYQQYLKSNKSKLNLLPETESEALKESFMRSFGKLLREIAKWQRIGDLHSIGWISLMFVRSSIKSGDYEFRWDLYDEFRDLFRHAPIFYWSPESLFAYFEEDVVSFLSYSENLKKPFNEGNMPILKEIMMKSYFSVIEGICQDGMNEILRYDVWRDIEKSDNIKVTIEHFLMSNGILYVNDINCQQIL